MQEILKDEKLLRRVEQWNLAILAAMTLGAAAFVSLKGAAGVLLGGAVAILSFLGLKWQLRRAFIGAGRVPGKGALFLRVYTRFLATAFVVFTVIYYGWVSPVALLAGLSVVMWSIVGVAIQQAFWIFRKGER
ncbi:MAG: ATP synthase subunit I [Thermodesulfobacteriota bacterium]|nr:ATP synthase subunit I [Thermodesulfobacteriota bacterium]